MLLTPTENMKHQTLIKKLKKKKKKRHDTSPLYRSGLTLNEARGVICVESMGVSE